MAPCSSLPSRRLRSFIESLTELEHVVSRLLRVAPCAAHDDRRLRCAKPRCLRPTQQLRAVRGCRTGGAADTADAALSTTAYVRSACNPPVAPTVRALVVSMRRAILRMNWTGISIAFVGVRHSCGTTRREMARKTVEFLRKVAPRAGLEPATLRLTGGKRNVSRALRPPARRCRIAHHRP